MKNFRDRIETICIKPEVRNDKKIWVLYVNGKDRMQTETDSIKELHQMMLETDFEKAKWLTSEIMNTQEFIKEYGEYIKGGRGAVIYNQFKIDLTELLKEAQTPLLKALETIKDAFWTEGETSTEKIADLKGIAEIAIQKNQEE